MQVEGRVALVTGAGSGIGQAAAALRGEGAKVAALGRTDKELERRVADSTTGGDARHRRHLQPATRSEHAIGQVVERWGRLDIVFANAGVNGVWAPIEELADDEWERTLDINLTGTFLTIKYAVPHLKRQGGRYHHVVGQRDADVQQHRRDGLLVLQGGAGRPRQDARPGTGPAQGPRQRDLPRRHRDRDRRQHRAARPGAREDPRRVPRGEGAADGRAGPARPSRWHGWCSSSRRTPPTTSRARRSGSTARSRS